MAYSEGPVISDGLKDFRGRKVSYSVTGRAAGEEDGSHGKRNTNELSHITFEKPNKRKEAGY